jgi:hypothetical protein
MNSEKIKKYINKSLPALHKLAKRYFNLYIRLRDVDENGIGYCIAKGIPLSFGSEQCQAGHYYAAGSYKSLEFNEDNVHLQSKHDNYFVHDFAAYAANLVKKIGQERFDKLNFLADYEKQHGYKQDKFTLIGVIETYKAKAYEMAKLKGIEI